MRMGVRHFTATLALTGVAVAYVLWQGSPERPRPRLQRPPAATRPASPVAPLTARATLDRSAELSLSADQVARLEALERERREEFQGLEAVVNAAAADFSAFMTQAQDGRGTSLEELHRRSAEYGDLSAELREQRRRHAAAVLEVLTVHQRQMMGSAAALQVPGDRR